MVIAEYSVHSVPLTPHSTTNPFHAFDMPNVDLLE